MRFKINFIVGTAIEWQFAIIVLLSTGIMLFVQLHHPFYIGGGDPYDYLNKARYMLGVPGGINIPWRAPGMSWYHILSGVVIFDTWRGFIVGYALMSVAIPILIYLSFNKLNRNIALVIALLSAVSMVPYAYSKTAMSDHLFHFIHFLSIFLIARYFRSLDSWILPIAITLAVFYLNSVRPIAALFYWTYVFCALFLIWQAKYWASLKPFLLSLLLYIVLQTTSSLIERDNGGYYYSTSYAPTTIAEKRFAEVYFSGGQFHFVPEQPPQPIIKESDGKVSTKLYEVLRNYLKNYPERWQKSDPDQFIPYKLFAKFKGKEELLVKEIMSKPNFTYFNFLRMAISAHYGTGMDDFLLQLAAEHNNVGFSGILRFILAHPGQLFIGPTPPMGWRNLLLMYYGTGMRYKRREIYSFNWLPMTMINEANGPYAQEFLRAVKFNVYAFPQLWQDTNYLFHRYKGDPAAMFYELFNPTDSFDMTLLEDLYGSLVIRYYGAGPANKLFMNVVLEIIKNNPLSVLVMYDNLIKLNFIRIFDPITSPINFDFLLNRSEINYSVRTNEMNQHLSEKMKREIQETITSTPEDPIKRMAFAYSVAHLAVVPFAFLAMFLLMPALLYLETRIISLFLALTYLYNVLVIAVFGNFGGYRYEDVFLLLPMMITIIGLYSLFKLITNRNS